VSSEPCSSRFSCEGREIETTPFQDAHRTRFGENRYESTSVDGTQKPLWDNGLRPILRLRTDPENGPFPVHTAEVTRIDLRRAHLGSASLLTGVSGATLWARRVAGSVSARVRASCRSNLRRWLCRSDRRPRDRQDRGGGRGGRQRRIRLGRAGCPPRYTSNI